MTIKKAIKICKEKRNKEMERGQLFEAELWQKHAEQLEIIGIILGDIKIKEKDREDVLRKLSTSKYAIKMV